MERSRTRQLRSRLLRKWRNTIDELLEKTGVSLEEVCRYAGFAYNGKETAIYKKLPRKRSAFIGVGMALGMPLEEINSWIVDIAGKRKLYAKDISEDLVWIYLIEANAKECEKTGLASAGAVETDGRRNYFSLYEKCQSVAYATWKELWDELTMDPEDTADVEIQLENVDYDDNFEGLKTFIIDHMDSFKVAYAKPRKMLDDYVELILSAFREGGKEGMLGLTDLRGWLDDSMINYLAGDSEMINVIDKKSHRKTVKIKYVPRSRRVHISMCLALGMCRGEIDRYLEMMGFAPIDTEEGQEAVLAEALDEWEAKEQLPAALKNDLKRETADDTSSKSALTGEKKRRAAEEMLMLRQELAEEYEKRGIRFPYLKIQKDEN